MVKFTADQHLMIDALEAITGVTDAPLFREIVEEYDRLLSTSPRYSETVYEAIVEKTRNFVRPFSCVYGPVAAARKKRLNDGLHPKPYQLPEVYLRSASAAALVIGAGNARGMKVLERLRERNAPYCCKRV